MAFQLLDESWIPVRRADGLEWIPPWRITDRGRRGCVVDVASVRPDFDGAFLEFLIGLVQTVLTPATEDEWFDRWDTPPAPDELREAVEPFRDAFVLDGDGPRFMQNHEALVECDSPRPIAWLFMDAPSENTEKENRDLFIKRRGFQRLCPGCAAAALFTLQTFASSGGSGHFSSLRGKGPLSTPVLGDDLWHTVWANVLSRSQLHAHGSGSSNIRFPWMPLKSRNAPQGQVLPNTVHPVYRYWAVPRRIWLIFGEATFLCDLCGRESEAAVAEYATRPRGNRHQGPWRHPLTPYRILPDGTPLPIEGAADGTGYRHWLGLTLGGKSGKVTTEPAQVVRVFASRRKDMDVDRPEFRIRAYGYDMDNMKARGFCFGEMPAWSLAAPKLREAFAFEVQRLVSAADYVAVVFKSSVFEALVHSKRGGGQHKALAGRTLFATFVARFWSTTEPDFFARLPELYQAVCQGEETVSIRETWRRRLASAAMDLFEEATSAADDGGGDVKRVAKAQRALRFAVGPWSRKMQKLLDLTPPARSHEETEEGAVP